MATSTATGEVLCQYCGEVPAVEDTRRWARFDRLCARCAYWQLAEIAEKVAGNLVSRAYDHRSPDMLLRTCGTLQRVTEELRERAEELGG